MKRIPPSRAAALALALPLLVAGSCGYAQGYAAQELGVRTLFVQTVANETYLQGVDQRLTQQLTEDLTSMTGLVPARLQEADAILEVRLVSAGGQSIIGGGLGSQREGSVVLECSSQLRDPATGRILYRRRHADRAEYRLAVGETRDSAYDELLRDLSRKILISLGREGRVRGPAASEDPGARRR